MHNKFLFAVILLLLVGGSSAQQSSSPETNSKKQDHPCTSAKTQIEMNQCYEDQFRKTEARLNAVYGKLMDSMEKRFSEASQAKDEDQQRYEDNAIKELKAAQTAWFQYRDLHCAAASHQFEGGSISPMVFAVCMSTTTEDRISELKQAYESDDLKLE
jgi:uncharacterized protein YecT (DUF1311 family)